MISAGVGSGLDGLTSKQIPRKTNAFGATNIELTLGKDASAAYMRNMQKQQKWNNWNNLGIDVMNATTNILGTVFKHDLMGKQIEAKTKAMKYNYMLGSKMIEFQHVDSQNKKEVALAAMQTQENIARIGKSQNVAIAQIGQSAKTDRTRIYAALSAARRGYTSGLPFQQFAT